MWNSNWKLYRWWKGGKWAYMHGQWWHTGKDGYIIDKGPDGRYYGFHFQYTGIEKREVYRG